jgi:hypothetical protein
MRLTTLDRDAFVRAVMDDVPQTDYDSQAQEIANGIVRDAMPAKVRDVYDDPELRDYLRSECFYGGNYLDSIYLYGVHVRRDRADDAMKLSDIINQALADLSQKAETQTKTRRELRDKARAAIYACNTLKQARDALPEFVKYLPADRNGATSNVPVIAGLVTDLMAAGWPKGGANGHA